MEKYSVLMSVYFKEKPDFFRTAVNSIFDQTLEPDELVLVCDGPLGQELEEIITEQKQAHGPHLRVVRLRENKGLGTALQVGLKRCRNNLVGRMDSDDISLPDRFRKQVDFMTAHPEISVLGGAIAEFQEDPSQIESIRNVPEFHDEIITFSKKRNPFNHVSVIFRKDAVLSVGGYRHFSYLEDYYLWIRMFLKGYQGHNLPDVLVNVRIGNGMMNRRSGMKYAASQERLFRYMWKERYISGSRLLLSTSERVAVSLVPNWLRGWVYRILLRRGS